MSDDRPKRLLPGLGVLLTGAFTTQAISLAGMIVIARVYGPSSFGIASVFTSVISMLLTVACWRLELAIPTVAEEKDGKTLLILCILVAGIMGVASLVAVGVIQWTWFPSKSQGMSWFWFVPTGVAAGGVLNALKSWALRIQEFRRISIARVTQVVVQIIAQIGFGVAGIGYQGLLIGYLIGLGAGVVVLLGGCPPISRGYARPSGHLLLASLRHHWRYPLISSPSAVINSLGLYLPSVLMNVIYSPASAGWFAVAYRIGFLPSTLAGESVAGTYLANAPGVLRNEPVRGAVMFSSIARRLFAFGIGWALVVNLGLTFAIPLVLGIDWSITGIFIRYISIAALFAFVAVPLSQTLNIVDRQDLQFWWDVYRLVSVVGILGGCWWVKATVEMAVLAYALGTALAYFILTLISYRCIRRRARVSQEPLKEVGSP